MRGFLRNVFGTGSVAKPIDHKDGISSDSRLSPIAAAAPDPALAADDQRTFEAEQTEGIADRVLAQAETPFWMRHMFGEVRAEYRIPLGLILLLLLVIVILSIIGVATGAIDKLFGLLQAIVGGLIGGEIVKRAGDRR